LKFRIAETERYRDRVAAYLASDKAHYLATLQFILGILLLMCMGVGVFLLGRLTLIPGDFELVALARPKLSRERTSLERTQGSGQGPPGTS